MKATQSTFCSALLLVVVSAFFALGATAQAPSDSVGSKSPGSNQLYKMNLSLWDGDTEVASPVIISKLGTVTSYQTFSGEGDGYKLDILVSQSGLEGGENLLSVVFDIYSVDKSKREESTVALASPSFVVEPSSDGDPVYFSMDQKYDVAFTLSSVSEGDLPPDGQAINCDSISEGKPSGGSADLQGSGGDCCSGHCDNGRGFICCGDATWCCDCGECCQPAIDPCQFVNCPDYDPF